MLRTLLLGLAAAAIPILSASATPATPEEAARLIAVFERYVGHPAPGEAGSVTVASKGDGYVATLDLKRALAGLESLGVTLDPVVSTVTLLPLPDGTWTVTSRDSPPVTMHLGQQTVSLTSATSNSEGLYDPKIFGFSRFHQDQTGYDLRQTGTTTVQDRRTDRVMQDVTGAPAAGGGVDVHGHLDLAGTVAEILVKSAPATDDAGGGNPAVPPPSSGMAFSYKIPTSTVDIGLDRFRSKDLLDLWAFLVAHPDRPSLTGAQDDLKALLRSGLPYVANVKESAGLDSFSLTTPIGLVSAKTLRGSLDAAGLDGIGRVALALTIADLAVPSGQLPPWSAGLVPTDLDLHVALDGFHATEAATEAVNDIDLGKDVIITPEQKEAVSHLFWPGSGTVTLAPSRVTTAVLDLKIEGQAAMAPQPAGRITVTGRGLDKEIAALQAQAATDPGAAQILSPLVLAKNLSKPNPDGSLVWVIDFGHGPVTINGATLQ